MFGRGNKDSYLTYKKVNIGLSNISSLVFRDPEHADIINFSKDGYYYAYLCDDKAVIEQQKEFYDDKINRLLLFNECIKKIR
jgi:hypothetical protein